MTDPVLISHDATLVVSALVRSGGSCDLRELERQVSPRLMHGFLASWSNLLDSGLARQLHGAAQLHAMKLRHYNPQNQNFQNHEATLHEVSCSVAIEADQCCVADLVSRATDRRNFHADYQAVLAGKKARRDPLQEYVARLNPADRGEFWGAYLELSIAEQSDYRRRVARLAARGGRDRSPPADG
jgi:hypothetical protein